MADTFSEAVFWDAQWVAFREAWDLDALFTEAIIQQRFGYIDHLQIHLQILPSDDSPGGARRRSVASSIACPPDCLGDHR